MDTAPITAAANAVASVTNYWQVLFALIITGGVVFTLWLMRVGGESKKLVAKSEEKERLEVEVRKLERDRQFDEVDRKHSGLSVSFDKHVKDQCARDAKMTGYIETIAAHMVSKKDFQALQVSFDSLKEDLHRIDKSVVELRTILVERFKAQ